MYLRASGDLERMELDLGLRLDQNGARSQPPLGPLMIAKSLFLSLFWSTMVVVGLVTLLAWVWWLIGGVDFWFGRRGSGVVVVGSGFNCVGLGLIVFFWVCCDWFLDLGLIWVGLFTRFMGLICWEFGVDYVRIWRRTWRIRRTSCKMKNKLKNIKKCFLIIKF